MHMINKEELLVLKSSREMILKTSEVYVLDIRGKTNEKLFVVERARRMVKGADVFRGAEKGKLEPD